MCNSRRWLIRINGTVQGVGFRPFVYRTATALGLAGEVRNTPEGVTIQAQGGKEQLKSFVRHLRDECPPLARIQELVINTIALCEGQHFSIVASDAGTNAKTLVSPDIAPCDQCLSEVTDPSDRRFGYPFINCTNCGPRFTIIESIPYDRPLTTMKSFTMCEQCASEYEDSTHRRFHAQPNACPVCGPRLRFVAPHSGTIAHAGNALKQAVAALKKGEIVAIKGAGGFHLACDATNVDAVTRLRQRKQRDQKPFAIMVGSLECARRLCHISEVEASLLASPQRPIVLLQKKARCPVCKAVAPGNKNLGLMLPSTPLHYLLFNRGERRVLVMTSGNITDEPIAYQDEEAFDRLRDIADAFVIHDRDIHIRVDDSIARTMEERPLLLRRARGYVPQPIRLAFDMPSVWATGADLKGSICLIRGRNAFLSQHLGDLENAEAHRFLEQATDHLQKIFAIKPEIIAYDLHPDYASTRYAKGLGLSQTYAIQHHHAHIASCMAENDLPNEKVIGIALDGTGLGTDETIWGGEILLANYTGFRRQASFKPVPMPGGDAAAKQPWRMALSYLNTRRERIQAGYWEDIFKNIDEKQIRLILQMLEKNINCPLTSSCGRLFDAVSALLGICTHNSFEGQAAMELEQAADENETGSYDFSIEMENDESATSESVMRINFSPMIDEILKDLKNDISSATISARFHNTVAKAIIQTCTRIASQQEVRRAALSGGCFQNAILTSRIKKGLVEQGFQVYTHSLVPPNDGGVALGQAVIAAHLHRG